MFSTTAAQFDLLTPELLKNYILAMPHGVGEKNLRDWAFAWVSSPRFHDDDRRPCCLSFGGDFGVRSHLSRCALLSGRASASADPVPPESDGRSLFTLPKLIRCGSNCCYGCVGAIEAQDLFMRSALLGGPAPPLSDLPALLEPDGSVVFSLTFQDAHTLAMNFNDDYHGERRRCGCQWRIAEIERFAENLLIWQRLLVACRNHFADLSAVGNLHA